jgi:membrane protease YdiL (CAAX protease family)
MPAAEFSADFNYVAFVIGTLLLVAIVGYGTYRAAQLLPNWPPDDNPLLQPFETTARIIMILVCIGLGFFSGLPWATLGWQLPEPVSQIGWGALWGCVIAAVYIVGTRVVMAKSGGRFYTPNVVRVIVPRTNRQFFLIALVMVSIVLLEELLFRSLLIGGLTPILPVWFLLAASALIFGLMHSPQGWWGMSAIAVGGVALGYMFIVEQSLLMPMVAHYVANMVQIAYAYWWGIPEIAELTPP